jgi:hypothetical protein
MWSLNIILGDTKGSSIGGDRRQRIKRIELNKDILEKTHRVHMGILVKTQLCHMDIQEKTPLNLMDIRAKTQMLHMDTKVKILMLHTVIKAKIQRVNMDTQESTRSHIATQDNFQVSTDIKEKTLTDDMGTRARISIGTAIQMRCPLRAMDIQEKNQDITKSARIK